MKQNYAAGFCLIEPCAGLLSPRLQLIVAFWSGCCGANMRVRFPIFLTAIFVNFPALADRSCAEVNKLYDDTRSVSRYQETMVWTPPGGTASNFVLEQRYNGRDMFERDQAGICWKHSPTTVQCPIQRHIARLSVKKLGDPFE